MKKFLAILLALSLVATLAACGAKESPEPTDTTAEEVTEEITDVSEPEEETDISEAEEETDVSDEETSEEVIKEGEETTKEEETNEEDKLDTVEEIVAYYNAAVIKTDKAGKTPGSSKMALASDITGDGFIGAILKVLMPAAKRALEKNSTPTDDIPGRGTLKASDVVSATATQKNGKTEIYIKLKEQVDGSDGDGLDGGPVARGVGTLGSIDVAFAELGAELLSGRETIKLTYKDAYIKCIVDDASGKIVSGTWHYAVHALVGDAEVKLGVKANIKNLKGVINYTVTI